ncbi:beta-agarase [Opitutus sp. ER46]|uniref:beta-agarase n=1 Tax=Opitutus sp. ER46 TaxID=2161864 RepID=UPI000D3002F8|nr:beta-agarase [Opitutus sp. ER46]PTX91377.1 beta-agarase [Opitutus sp. ER46]
MKTSHPALRRLLPLLVPAALVLTPSAPFARPLPDDRASLPVNAASGAEARLQAQGWLTLRAAPDATEARLQLTPPAGGWKLDACAELAVPVRNLSPFPVRVVLHVDDHKSRAREPNPLRRGVRAELALPAGNQVHWLIVPLAGPADEAPPADRYRSLVVMPHEFVRRGVVEAARVRQVRLVLPDVAAGAAISVGPLEGRGTPAPLANWTPDKIFPLVDLYGQYRHRDWPEKITREADFTARRDAENQDLAAHARPADWDRFGGWAKGPQREATGFFRTEKIDGRWWLIDPEGRLFWSHGVVRVGTRVRVGGIYHGTPLPDREHYFELPPAGSPYAAFFGTEPESTRGYYVGRPNHAVYDHLEANLSRKFGAGWVNAYATEAQRRLASWGLNTIANSSDPAVYERRQTPYTAIVYSAPMGDAQFRLAGSKGNWGKLPDPFDPGWAKRMRDTLRADLKSALNDPWCLGFFVDNELNWSTSTYVAECTLASPATQHAKRAFLTSLQARYADIAALNTAWGTRHATWDGWLAATDIPDLKRAAVRSDLEAFTAQYLEAYFSGCRAAVKAESPHHLYLGCRFAQGANPLVMGIAVRHCDVISINRYATLVSDVALPDGLDRPILIGEFHFGALDRGPLAPALVPVPDQAARATAYAVYVESALRNPHVIGTHWFQYFDQPTTGRFDGENYQTGLVDICDTPYRETVGAVRQIASRLYELRNGASRPAAPAPAPSLAEP